MLLLVLGYLLVLFLVLSFFMVIGVFATLLLIFAFIDYEVFSARHSFFAEETCTETACCSEIELVSAPYPEPPIVLI